MSKQQKRMMIAEIIIAVACLTILLGLGGYVLWQNGSLDFLVDRRGEESTEFFGQTENERTEEALFGTETSAENTTEGTQITEESTEPETEPETDPETESEEMRNLRRLVAEADRLAAGYDYDKAMELIASQEDYQNQALLMEALVRYENAKALTVRYAPVTEITHVFYHSLIVDPALAFDGDGDTANYNKVMTTVEEFKKIMQEMYDRGYVLVNLRDIAHIETRADGTEEMVEGDIYLPPGKIPYVLSIDDPSYYHYMEGDGFADRIIIDENGRPRCEYTQPDGTVVVGDFDVVPLVEAFIEEHPDAAYRGARGILALTGYNGILGYRTDPSYLTWEGLLPDQRVWLEAQTDFDYEWECEQAKKVASALKELGWEFASHSYGHRNYKTISQGDLVWDIHTWLNTVGSLVGETDILIYAYGADISGRDTYNGNEKYEYLKGLGFDYFCNVDSSRYWVQMGDGYLRQGRRNLDGTRMWEAVSGGTDRLSDLFDAAEVFDEARPRSVG